MTDMVNHPPHYKSHPSGVECIDVVRHMNFNRGNAVKYLWRAGQKGNELEDVKKALWYLQDEVKRMEAEAPAEASQPAKKLEHSHTGGGRLTPDVWCTVNCPAWQPAKGPAGGNHG